MSSTTFQTTPAQPTNAFSEVGSTRLDTVKIVAIVIAGVLLLTVLILITMILIILLKRQGKSVKEKQHNNNLSMGNHSLFTVYSKQTICMYFLSL